MYTIQGAVITYQPKANLGCVRLTIFRLFRNKNKISKLSPNSESNQIVKSNDWGERYK